MEELTTEQLEVQETQQRLAELKHSVEAGRKLKKLQKTQEFKDLFEEMFLTTGKDILWQNIRNLNEWQMMGRGNDQNLEMIEKMKSQVKSRIDFAGFLDTIEHDAENAQVELEEMEG